MGKLTETFQRLLDTLQISSASPGHINVILQSDPSIDLDEALSDALEDTEVKEQKEVKDTVKTVKGFKKGNIGDLNRMSSQQFGNIKEMARNPFTFIFKTFFRKFAKGAGIIALAIIIFEAVKFIISELLKPGRLLDRRFKRDIKTELIAFRKREEQQKLKQGFSQIIITTTSGLRGGQGQTYNTFDHIRDRTLPPNIGLGQIALQASGTSFSKHKGVKRSSRFG